jgi:E3 ubiquitin-protein ligase HERC2
LLYKFFIFHPAHRFAHLLEQSRLHEFDQQLAAMKRGFGTIVPLRLMPLFTWQEAEVLVCGSPEIDLDDLKQHTAYQGYKGSDDPTIKHFWTVMEEWGHKERSKFIQFAWGRQRLPRPGNWTRKMLLSNTGNVTDLPVAHTCFFHVELPPYKTS